MPPFAGAASLALGTRMGQAPPLGLLLGPCIDHWTKGVVNPCETKITSTELS